MNFKTEKGFKRLRDSVNASYAKMSDFREYRKALIKAYVGSEYYGKVGEKTKTTYLNLLYLATSIYTRQLAVRAPTPKVTTPYRELRPLARNLKLALEDLSDDIELGLVLRIAATDALFSPMSVVKQGLVYNGEEDYEGSSVAITTPFVKNVSFDNLVIDMSEGSGHNPAFIGDRYFITKERFDQIYKDPIPKGENGDAVYHPDNADRTESISQGDTGADERLEDIVALQDVWVYGSRTLVTYLADKITKRPLKVIDEFDGPEEPYKLLSFNVVPDNTMPMAPFGQVKSIHNVCNSIIRRLVWQVENKKDVTAFENPQDAKQFRDTKDGHGMVYTGREPRDLHAGGIDQPSLALLIQLKDMFSWATGNLDSLGGLSPMSETAKQDQLLFDSASAQIKDMQDATTEFARKIEKSLAWYEYTEPVRTRTLEKGLEGTSYTTPILWDPSTIDSDFLDLNTDINPVSMRDEMPEQKLGKIEDILNRVVGPMMPLLQEQGMTIDVQRLVEIASDYSNIPELTQIVVPIGGSQEQGDAPVGNAQPQLGKPAETKRTYERINRSGATRGGKDMALVSSLLGANVQGDEQKAIFGSVS